MRCCENIIAIFESLQKTGSRKKSSPTSNVLHGGNLIKNLNGERRNWSFTRLDSNKGALFKFIKTVEKLIPEKLSKFE